MATNLLFKPKKRVGRPPILSEYEKKARKSRLNKILSKSKIAVGNEIDRWNTLMEDRKIKTNVEMAKFLLDMYYEKGLGKSSNESKVFDINNIASELIPNYIGCTVKGLPIGVPCLFEIEFPTDINVTTNKTDMFIILPYQIHGHNTASMNKHTDQGISPLPNKNKESNVDLFSHNNELIPSIKVCSENNYSSNSTVVKSLLTEIFNIIQQETEHCIMPSQITGLGALCAADYSSTDGYTVKTDKGDEHNIHLNIECETDSTHSKNKTIFPEPEQEYQKHASLDTEKHLEIESSMTCSRQKRGMKGLEGHLFFPEIDKLIEVKDDEMGQSRRKSSRIRSSGFRPDYRAIEEQSNIDIDDWADVKPNIENGTLQDKSLMGNVNSKEMDEYVKKQSLNQKLRMFQRLSNKKNKKNVADPDFDIMEYSKKLEYMTESESNDTIRDAVHTSDSDQCSKIKNVNTKFHRNNLPSTKFDGKDLTRKRKSSKIIFNINEHSDKFYTEKFGSFQRKDRSKSLSEVSVDIFVCKICESFRSENINCIKSHIEDHLNEKLDCTKCGLVFCKSSDVWKHIHDKHKTKCLLCSECGCEFFGKWSLKHHMGRAHDKPQFKCSYCNKLEGEVLAFKTHFLLRKHIFDKHSQMINACSKCKQIFPDKNQLDLHIDDGCIGRQESVTCDQCGKAFGSNFKLTRHTKRVHFNIRNHQCPHCSFSGFSQAVLKKHILTHTGFHPYKCDLCPFSCIQCYQLTSHMRTHTGEKPYKCDQCNFAAAWNVQLKDHKKAHTTGTAILCTLCNVLFKNSKLEKNHLCTSKDTTVTVEDTTKKCKEKKVKSKT